MRIKKKNRIPVIIISLILLYIVLLYLLVQTEGEASGFGGASDAIWYLLATLTTVGYGDIAPVTPFGRLIGAVLMLMSAGVVTWFIGVIISLFYGRLLPVFWLWRNRSRTWYIFSAYTPGTCRLASSLAQDDADAAWIFLGKEKALSAENIEGVRHLLIVDSTLESILSKKQENSPCHIFLLGSDSWENIELGKELLESTADRSRFTVTCLTKEFPTEVPLGLKLVNRADMTSRSYWMNHPITSDEKNIVVMGDGLFLTSMLERSFMINVLPKDRCLNYHVFGDWQNFLRDHPSISKAFSIGTPSNERDSVVFDDRCWNEDPNIITEADRIIICFDDEHKNVSLASELLHYFPTKGRVFVRSNTAPAGAECFGTDQELLTRDLVMDNSIDHIAILLNEMYRQKAGSGSPWEELSSWHRESNIASADHLRTKIALLIPGADTRYITDELCKEAYDRYIKLSEDEKDKCRWLEHERWCRFHYMNNWRFGDKKDMNLRLHPLLVPYEKLTQEEKILDDSSWEVLGDLSSALKTK